MGDVVNLRTARKRAARLRREKEADRNRIEHGRSKEERILAAREAKRAEQEWHGHRLTDHDID